jgi:hypothetical protein
MALFLLPIHISAARCIPSKSSILTCSLQQSNSELLGNSHSPSVLRRIFPTQRNATHRANPNHLTFHFLASVNHILPAHLHITPSYFSSPSPCAAAAPFSAANLSLFLLPIILSVFFFSISAILSQFEIRLMVPSTLTTMGPRWSSETVVPPVLMSSWVALAGAAGRARGALGASLLDVSGCCCSVGAEEFEE